MGIDATARLVRYEPGQPVTNTDFYLAALLEEIRGLRRDLAAAPAAKPADVIELRERGKRKGR